MNLIPNPDALGLPAPAWFLITLMLVTQLLHIIFMNFVLGGSWFLVWTSLGKEEWKKSLMARCLNVMPVAISMAITFGIGPLLFVQVLYGQFFYVANVLLSWFWLSILLMAMVGFYLTYLQKADTIAGKGPLIASSGLRTLVFLIAALCFTGIAFLYTTNAALSQNPEVWKDARNGSALAVAWSALGYLAPRFLHNVIGAFGIAGIWIIWIAALRGKDEEAQNGARIGTLIALIAAALQVITGFWYILALPKDVLKAMMGFHSLGSIGLTLGILLGIGLLVHLALLLPNPLNARLRWMASGLAVATLLTMVMANQGLREEMLAKHFSLSEWTVATQWGPVLLFLVLFLGGVGTVLWIARICWNANFPGSKSA